MPLALEVAVNGNQKEAILVASTPQHRALPVNCRPHSSLIKTPPSPEESGDSSSSDTEPEDHWTEVWKLAARDGNWEIAEKLAASVVYKQGRNPKWEAIPYRELKQLCKACKDYAPRPPYCKKLLNVTFLAHVLVLHDLQHIMFLLLFLTELPLWESLWNKQLKVLIKNYKNEEARALLTIDLLRREGDFEKPQDQAQDIPRAVLEDIKNAVQTALSQTPDGTTPQQNSTDIHQGVDETYIKFIDRRQETIDKQIVCLQGRNC